MFWFHVYLTENSANIPWPCLLQEETLKFRRFAAKVCGWSRHYIFSKFEGPAFKDSWSSCTICLLSVPAPRIFWHALPPPLLPCLSIEEESDPEISRIYFNIHEWSQANHVQRVSQAVWLYLQYMFAFAREIIIKIVPLQIQFCSMWCAKKLGHNLKTTWQCAAWTHVYPPYFLATFLAVSRFTDHLLPCLSSKNSIAFSFGKACRPAWQRTLNLILSNFSCTLPSRLP